MESNESNRLIVEEKIALIFFLKVTPNISNGGGIVLFGLSWQNLLQFSIRLFYRLCVMLEESTKHWLRGSRSVSQHSTKSSAPRESKQIALDGADEGVKVIGMRVKGPNDGVEDLGTGVEGLGAGVEGPGVGVEDPGVGVKGLDNRVEGPNDGVEGPDDGVEGPSVGFKGLNGEVEDPDDGDDDDR
jgi:hypothetical protein